MIFFDLDGPLLDVSEKYFVVYRSILAGHGFESVSKETYWEAKRSRVPDTHILAMTGAEGILHEFHRERRRLIESAEFLALDTLNPGAIKVLEDLPAMDTLVLVTLRSRFDRLREQLIKLGLFSCFRQVLSSNSDEQPRWRIKFRLISNYLQGETPKVGIVVGDTETDIVAGKQLGFHTVGYTNGIRTESLLLAGKPDYLLNDIRGLPTLIRGLY